MKTHTVKASDIRQEWYLVDANGKALGRLASGVAKVLRGKHRPDYSPHLHLGDHVIVVNAEKIQLTGGKRQRKIYYSYSGYQSGLRTRTLQEMMQKDPRKVVLHAVRGMLPSNRLGRRLLKKLKVYVGPEHPHSAQKPKELSLQL